MCILCLFYFARFFAIIRQVREYSKAMFVIAVLMYARCDIMVKYLVSVTLRRIESGQ